MYGEPCVTNRLPFGALVTTPLVAPILPRVLTVFVVDCGVFAADEPKISDE